jgi:radical SAM superfamily enzyme YgiQ (UPF0313 family)
VRILLVYPEFPDTFWSFKHALKFVRKESDSPPLGLLTVAAMLPRDWDLRLVDMNIQRLTNNDLLWADYVFLGGMVVQQQSARQVITRCQELGVPIVAGGPMYTCEPEKFEDVDHLVLNEAETTLPLFLADLEQGIPPARVYSTDDYPDIRQSPVPRWDLIDIKRYASMSIQFSRGCPYDCEFCNVTALLGHRPRTKTAEQIIAELDGLYA